MLDALKAARSTAILALGLKSVDKRVTDYEVALSEMVTDVLNGDAPGSKLAQKIRTLIRESAGEVVVEALEDAGDEQAATDAEDDEFQAILQGWQDDQLDYVDGFADDVVTAHDDMGKQGVILARVEAWAASLASLGAKIKASYLANTFGTWHLGKTELHCDTCGSLDGQRHRLKWFRDKGYMPQEPGSEKLECGGWRCDCTIDDDDGEQLLP